MSYILSKIGVGFLAVLMSLGIAQAPITPVAQDNLLVGGTISQSVAGFSTSLVSSISTSDTSMELVSVTTDDGTTLTDGVTYGFVIDVNTASEEFVIGTASSTNIINMTRGISVTTGRTSITALKKNHRRGASVKITDHPVLIQLARIANGQDGFPNTLYYDANGDYSSASSSVITDKNYQDTSFVSKTSTSSQSIASNLTASGTLDVVGQTTFTLNPQTSATPSSGDDLTNKTYVDAQVVAGGVPASTSTRGTAYLSVDPASSTAPIVIGQNDPILAGASTTPSLSNPLTDKAYVDYKDTVLNNYIDTVSSTLETVSTTVATLDSSQLKRTFGASGTIVAGNAVVIVPTSTVATTTQQNTSGMLATTTDSMWVAQEFTTSIAGNYISSVQVPDYKKTTGGSGYIRMKIRSSLTGSDLYSVNGSVVGDADNLSVTFSGINLSISPDTNYYLIFSTVNNAGTSGVHGTSTNVLSGSTYVSTDSGSSWGSAQTFDLRLIVSEGQYGIVKSNATNADYLANNFVGFAVNSATAFVSSTPVVVSGIYNGLSNLLIGYTYYLSDTAGAVSTSTGSQGRKIGTAISPTEILIKYDNP